MIPRPDQPASPGTAAPVPPAGEPTARVDSRRALGALGWLALAAVFALGGAGIVSATNQPPLAGKRPELTWTTDRQLDPALAAAAGDLAALSDDVDGLGAIGRRALTSLIDRDSAGISSALADGKTQLDLIAEATDTLRTRLAAIPGIGPDDATRIGAAVRQRYDDLVLSLSATDGLATSWNALTKGSLAAMDLTKSLAEHDAEAGAAAKLGRAFHYKQALATLDKADAALATTRQLRDKLANTTDVSILSSWIDRNAAFDGAVRKIWTLLVKSNGKVTKANRAAVEAAFAEYRAAQAALPPDSRSLIVIMSDVARGGMNQAVIGIEEVRGRLSAAADALGGG